MKDEMQRVAEGQRRNYQDVGAFVDIDDQWSLCDESVVDVVEAIDRRRALEVLPEAARFLVHETVVVGKTEQELAHDSRVTSAAMVTSAQGLSMTNAMCVRHQSISG